jgi:hypothetical protein
MLPRLRFAALPVAVGLLACSLSHGHRDADEYLGGLDSEVPNTRTFFYIGGEYANNGDGEHILRNQMYVERLRPTGRTVRDTPIVLIHGQGQTGTASDADTTKHPAIPLTHLRRTS